MSAIFGIYNRDGKPVSPRLLREMSDSLAHRGGDGADVWHQGSVGLGHRMLRTTPESFDEHLPGSYDGGDLVITADARIDNRDDLLKRLGLNDPAENICDSMIIISAYKKWGEDCASYLLGDFAFVIWDNRNRKIFCARDHFGIKPFYYYYSKAVLAFATETRALFNLPEISGSLNEEMIADYLVDNYEDKAATFYREILRLPPAHTLTVSPDRLRLDCYYALDPSRESASRTDEEYAEGLKEVFTESVRCRMRSAVPIGSMLSGGLDSSSIACVARNLLAERGKDEPLQTFSLVYDRVKECDEQRYINLVLSQGGFNQHLIPGDKDTPLTNLGAICRHIGRPSIGPGFSSTFGLYEAIASAGVKVVFDGHDGDSAVSYGYKHLDELARAGRWFDLAAEARAAAPLAEMSPFKIMAGFVERYRWKPFLQKHPRVNRVASVGRRLKGRSPVETPNANRFAQRNTLINKTFAERVDLEGRYKAHRSCRSKLPRTTRSDHFQMITTGGQALALEEYDAVTGAFGFEKRYPFWDKRLIEYCLSLPGDQKYRKGWNRFVMRRAMDGILPSEVCWRRDKTDFSANFIDGLANERRESLSCLLINDDDIFNKFFDRNAMHEAYQKLNSNGVEGGDPKTGIDLRAIWEIASLSSWLRQIARN